MPPKKPSKQNKKPERTLKTSQLEPTDAVHPSSPSLDLPEKEEEAKYRKRKIDNNWAKYDVDFLSQEPETAGFNNDFSFILNNSSSDSAFFQLSTEKEWEKQSYKTDESVFQLDVKLLSAGLACIPFYERIGVDKGRLRAEDVEKCDYHAGQSQEYYKTLIAKIQKAGLENEVCPIADESTATEANTKTDSSNRSLLTEPCDFVNSLKEALSEVSASVCNPCDVEEDDELEDWLDGVLDS